MDLSCRFWFQLISAKWLLHFDGCLRSLNGTLHLETPSMQDRPQILTRCGDMRVVLFSATRCRSGKELPCLLLSNCQTMTLGPLWARSQAALMLSLILPDKQEMISKQPAIVNQELISLTRSVGKQTSLTLAHLSICNCSVLPTYCVKRSWTTLNSCLFCCLSSSHSFQPADNYVTSTLTPPHHQNKVTSHLVGESISPSSVGNRHDAPHDANPTSQRLSWSASWLKVKDLVWDKKTTGLAVKPTMLQSM